jgi:hypothetical protein
MVKEGCFLPLKTQKALENQGLQRNSLYNHGEAVYEIRSLSAVWNQHEVLNVINPKEDTR